MQKMHSELKSSVVDSPRVKAQEISSRILTSVDEVIDVINEHEKKNFRLGVFLLIIAIGTWIIGLELVNSVLKGEEFQKPIFLAVLTGSCFTLNFIPNLISYIVRQSKQPSNAFPTSSPLLSTSDLEIDNRALQPSDHDLISGEVHKEPKSLDKSEVLTLAFQIAIIYLLYNVMVLSSLKYTSASNQTILGSTTTLFTLCLGVFYKLDRFSFKKIVCVGSSLVGVILINLGEKDLNGGSDSKYEPKNPLYGNFLALLGAFLYALYLLIMKVKCGTGEKTTNERELFGWVGLFSILMGVPLLFVADKLDVEKFQFPTDPSILAMITTNALFSVTSDYVTILAMLLTSPLVTSLALTSSIPITLIVDFVVLDFSSTKDSSMSRLVIYAFGIICILMSVILININVESENELIEQVIEETLELAIRDDEVLSPILSPYLTSSSALSRHNVGVHLSLSPRMSPWKKKLNPEPSGLRTEVSKFSLDAEASTPTESSSLQQANNAKIYHGKGNGSTVVDEGPGLFLSGGVNHNFSLAHISQP